MLDASAVKPAEVPDNDVFSNQIAFGTFIECNTTSTLDTAVSMDFVISNNNAVVIGIKSGGGCADGNTTGKSTLVTGDVVVADLQANGVSDGEDAATGF